MLYCSKEEVMEPIQEQVCAVETSIEEKVENLPIEEEIAQAEETSATTGIFPDGSMF